MCLVTNGFRMGGGYWIYPGRQADVLAWIYPQCFDACMTVVSLIGYFLLGFFLPDLWRQMRRPGTIPDGTYFYHATLQKNATIFVYWSGTVTVTKCSFENVVANIHQTLRDMRAASGE